VLSSYLKAVPGRDQPVALVVIVVQGPAGVPRMLPQSEAHGGRVTLPAPFSDAVYFDGNWLRYDGPQPERVVGRQGFKWSTSIQNTVTARLGQFTVAVIGDPTDGIRKDELLAVLRSMK
jgi:hypothetical protein